MYEKIETHSDHCLDEKVLCGSNGIDFNENERIESRQELRQDEEGKPYFVTINEYVYDTYRFSSLAEGFDWKHEKEREQDNLSNAEAIVGIYESIEGGTK